MDDVAPELLQIISEQFKNEYDSDNLIKNALAAMTDGTATYETANQYAVRIGEILAKAFGNNLSSDVLPEGKMYWNIAKRVVAPSLKNNHSLVSAICEAAQLNINNQAGIGIKPKAPKLNEDRLNGILNGICEADKYDDVAWKLKDPVVNFTQSVVDDSVRENAKFHAEAGLSPKVERRSAGNCCEWCNKLSGTYDYIDVKDKGNNVWRRHENCRCTVTYIEGSKRQNGWSKRLEKSENDIEIEKRKRIDITEKENLKKIKNRLSGEHESDIIKLKQGSKINIQLFAKSSKDFPTVILSKKEYGKVMHEIATNISDIQKTKKVFKKYIGNYIYTVENNEFGNYRIIGRELIE